MSATDDLGNMLDELCKKMLTQVSSDFVVDDEVPEEQTGSRRIKLSERIDAFKAASAYYIAKTKVKGKSKDSETDVPNFGSFREKIRAVEGGKA